MKPDRALRRISLLLKTWEYDLNDQDRFYSIIQALMDSQTTKEVNEIAMSNLNFIDRMGLWKHVNRAKRRINNLFTTKIKLTDLKYLN